MKSFPEHTKIAPHTSSEEAWSEEAWPEEVLSEDLLAEVGGGLDYELNPPSGMDAFAAPTLPDLGPSFAIDVLHMRV